MSGEYHVGNYEIFDDATNTTNNLDTDIDKSNEAIEKLKTILNNENVFMGPIKDSCVDGFDNVNIKVSEFKTNINTIKNYLTTTSQKYKAGDASANKNILQFEDNKISTAQAGTTTSGSTASTGHANRDSIYNYLSKQGFNDAAICGILANIEKESSFNPQALGDHGTSYGICQWHNSRWAQLKNFCNKNGLDSSSLDAQTKYLVWELKNNYPSVYQKLQSVPNTSQGAYTAAYEWTVHYEVPANKNAVGHARANSASTTYWSTYGKS